jgi:hypothetical protein
MITLGGVKDPRRVGIRRRNGENSKLRKLPKSAARTTCLLYALMGVFNFARITCSRL